MYETSEANIDKTNGVYNKKQPENLKINTDEIVVNICNNIMKVDPPLSVNDIERSHTIGPVKDGYSQILCKFKAWKTKHHVYMNKSNIKKHNGTKVNVFITEDLTRKRQFLVQQLEFARKSSKIDSFWTSDGRILYKSSPTSKVKSIRDVNDIDHLTINDV
jgi:hypothetical protein